MKQKRRTFSPPKKPADFARLLASKTKLSSGYSAELASGKKTPSLEKAVEFKRLYGIPPEFWIERAA